MEARKEKLWNQKAWHKVARDEQENNPNTSIELVQEIWLENCFSIYVAEQEVAAWKTWR